MFVKASLCVRLECIKCPMILPVKKLYSFRIQKYLKTP